jgi:hypothetical protein
MGEFNENDVTIDHFTLDDGRGYLRLTHRPSGLFVDARAGSVPIIKIKNSLLEELKEKVLSKAEKGEEKGSGLEKGSGAVLIDELG